MRFEYVDTGGNRDSELLSSLNVMLCALLVSPSERTVLTLPRNDWWARDVTASIDINAWPNEIFTLNQLTL